MQYFIDDMKKSFEVTQGPDAQAQYLCPSRAINAHVDYTCTLTSVTNDGAATAVTATAVDFRQKYFPEYVLSWADPRGTDQRGHGPSQML